MKDASYHQRRRTETIVFHQPNQSFKNTDERGEDSCDLISLLPLEKIISDGKIGDNQFKISYEVRKEDE